MAEAIPFPHVRSGEMGCHFDRGIVKHIAKDSCHSCVDLIVHAWILLSAMPQIRFEPSARALYCRASGKSRTIRDSTVAGVPGPGPASPLQTTKWRDPSNLRTRPYYRQHRKKPWGSRRLFDRQVDPGGKQ